MDKSTLYSKNNSYVEAACLNSYCYIKISCTSVSDKEGIYIYQRIADYIKLAILSGFKNRIIDFHDSVIDIDTFLLIQLSHSTIDLYENFPDSKCAIVAGNVKTFREIRIYHKIHTCQNGSRALFRNVNKAMAWISMSSL